MKKTALSIIVTLHHEGIIAHKTLLSIEQCLKEFSKPITYEIILHVDNGDEDTINYIKQYKKKTGYRIFYNSFGEPSMSRNFSVNKASGDYVLCIDGDDLISKNFIIDGLDILQKTKNEIILHPETNITFGYNEQQPRLWRMSDSFSDDEDTLIMFGRNRWCTGTFLKTSTAKKYPYISANKGFGYEDWCFNSDTRAGGVKHLVIPKSTIFHREKTDSTYALHVANHTVVAYTPQFETRRMQELAHRLDIIQERSPIDDDKIRRRLSYVYSIIKRTPGIKKIAKKMAEKAVDIRYGQAYKKMPKWLLRNWIEINKIDNSLYPDKQILARMPVYNSELDYLGRVYCAIISQIAKNPDYLFMPPVLNVGGTEKVIVNYLQAFAKIHPDWHIVVLSTLAKTHPYKIPNNVDFVDFRGLTSHLSDYDRDFILSRLIVQTRVKRLHIINDDFYYRWANAHKVLLKNNDYKIYVSHFMHEYTADPDRTTSFIEPHILELYPCITKIFTDNQAVIDEAMSNNAFDIKKFAVHYQPIEIAERECVDKKPASTKVKILWASRVSLQKRPDILKRIAKKLDPQKYQIDVYGRFQKPYTKEFFQDCKTINYCGTYNGIESLDTTKYDVFLYTSQTDGLPNILLEIGRLGLPIVASNDGGVKDLIKNNETGILVDLANIDQYVEGIKKIENFPKQAQRYVKNLQALINRRHTEQQFIKKVKEDVE